MPHAWCNSSDTPLRMLVIFSPGQIEGLFRTAAGVDDVDKITAIAARYGTKLVGPPLHGTAHSIHSPQPKGWPTLMLRGHGDAGLSAASTRQGLALAGFCIEPKNQGEKSMEMHSRQSLHEIYGISAPPRRRSRWRSIARLDIAGIPAVLKKAIEAKLAARCAIAELASLDDRMLRDLGITRSEIEKVVSRPRENVGTDDRPILPNDTGQRYFALPAISSPDLTPEECRDRTMAPCVVIGEQAAAFLQVTSS